MLDQLSNDFHKTFKILLLSDAFCQSSNPWSLANLVATAPFNVSQHVYVCFPTYGCVSITVM